MSYGSSPQQPPPGSMSVVKPDPVSQSPPAGSLGHRGPLQGDLRDMISMYIPAPGAESADPAQRGYTGVQQHYLGTVPLTHM